MFDPAMLRETDPSFRVLVATLEHPASTFLASLQREAERIKELLILDVEQLIDVVAALDGPAIEAPAFGRVAPQPCARGTRFGLEERTTAPDGRRLTAPFLASADDLRFALLGRFNEVEVRIRGGESLKVPLDLRQASADAAD